MKLLFVCTGNICRSPTAEGVARAMIAARDLAFEADSAGIGAWHVGEPPDSRSVRAAAGRGYDLSDQRARQVEPADFRRFDHIIALDGGHLRQLRSIPGAEAGPAVLSLMLDWSAQHRGMDVPDPYYGEEDGFGQVLDLIEAGVGAMLDQLTDRG